MIKFGSTELQRKCIYFHCNSLDINSFQPIYLSRLDTNLVTWPAYLQDADAFYRRRWQIHVFLHGSSHWEYLPGNEKERKKESNRNRTHMRKFRLFPFFLVCNNTPSVNHCYPISPNSPPLPHIHTHTHTQTFCLPVCLSFFSFSNNDNDIEFI